MMLIRLITLICLFTVDIQATSHWVVTEKGLIQPKEESPFLMEKPYDLIGFMNQDIRWQNIHNMYYHLVNRQTVINNLWYTLVKEASFAYYIKNDKYCSVADIDALDWYTSFMEDGRFLGVDDKEFLFNSYKNGNSDVPDCKKISSLTFSMFTFEHLDGMIHRDKLNASAEAALPTIFSSIMTQQQFGHWLSDVLRKNSSSWLHYNLAAIYWRLRGNLPKAMECSRRAVHYAPRMYKSVPLLCMGTILHRSKKTDDAVTVLGASVDHSPSFPIAHFTLGTAYAIKEDYNSSLKHFELSMKLHEKFNLANKFKNAVLCHMDMFEKMHKTRSIMKKLSNLIGLFMDEEVMWLKYQTSFLKSMVKDWKFEIHDVDGNIKRMADLTGMNIQEIKKNAEKNYMVKYFMDSPTYNEKWENDNSLNSIEIAYSLEKILKIIATTYTYPPPLIKEEGKMLLFKTVSDVIPEIGPAPPYHSNLFLPKKMRPVVSAKVSREAAPAARGALDTLQGGDDPSLELYPANMKVSRNTEPFDTEPDWPSNDFCKKHSHEFPDNVELIYPLYLPMENKGIKVGPLLTEGIGVPALVEHALPWHPPHCAPHAHTHAVLAKKGIKVQVANKAEFAAQLRSILLSYISLVDLDLVTKMDDAEIGQRIATAMKKKVSAPWVLHMLAGVWWRARGAAPACVHCLLGAVRLAPARRRDVPLAALASVLLDKGLIDDAASYAEDAYKINPYEPTTNFLLAQINMLKREQRAQLFHMRQVVRVQPRFLNGLARTLHHAWACIMKQVDTINDLEELQEPDAICAEVEEGVSMVCERDGTNCHVMNEHCDTATKRHSVSALIRLLEQSDEGLEVDSTVFDKFVEAAPLKRTDMGKHRKNFNTLVNTVDFLLKGCSHKGCSGLTSELTSDSSLSDEDCSMEHMQIDYWLATVSFKDDLQFDNNLVAEVAGAAGAAGAEPACAVPAGAARDFFVSRMLAVEADHWQPVLRAMHVFADIFKHYSYNELGAKLAKYVEMHPSWWVGLVGAAWWCGAAGRGACARACAAAAHHHAQHHHAHRAIRPLAVLLHLQGRHEDAKQMAYLAFYMSPKSTVESFLVAASHTYIAEYEQAAWMYRYALSFDEGHIPAKAGFHITMCLMVYGETARNRLNA